MATRVAESTKASQESTLIVCVYAPYNTSGSFEAYQEEFLSLVKTAGIEYQETYFCKIRTTLKAIFLTKGKLDDLVTLVAEKKYKRVIFSERLTPLQERNLEELMVVEVVDREQLILEIFKKSAHTAEGKIQVEMAEIEFMRTRLSGKGLECMQQSGLFGAKGPGETLKEKMRRYFAQQIQVATKRLVILQKSRDMQRKQRLNSNIPLVAIVGYTNAGKSSLLNVMTKSTVLAENKLFATLDTTTRELFLNDTTKILLSDTVGFISQLPHQLIKAFRSTLDEIRYANLLIHVIDLHNPLWEDHIRVVKATLEDLEVDVPMINVFNKTDLISPERKDLLASTMLDKYEPYVFAHTKSKEGIVELVEIIKTRFE